MEMGAWKTQNTPHRALTTPHSSLPKVLIPRHPVRSLFVLKLLAVNLALTLGVQNGVVSVCHVLPVGKLGKGRVLPLPYMMQLIRVAVIISRRIALTHKVGIVPVFPAVIVGKISFQPLLSAVICLPVYCRVSQRRASVHCFLH